MSGADLYEDGFPHGTKAGYEKGCRGSACPAKLELGISCREASVRYVGDWSYRRLVDEGLTPAQIVERERPAAAAPAPKPRPKPKKDQPPVEQRKWSVYRGILSGHLSQGWFAQMVDHDGPCIPFDTHEAALAFALEQHAPADIRRVMIARGLKAAKTVPERLVRPEPTPAKRRYVRLTEEQQREVLALLAEGRTRRDVATRFGVNITTIDNIRKRAAA